MHWLISVAFEPDGVVLRHPEPGTTAQVVPAIVVAIFVFAVGTLFVVAQVVPPARGTRAVTALRRRHRIWTISPAVVLAPGSAWSWHFLRPPPRSWPPRFFSAPSSTCSPRRPVCWTSSREATDPAAFARLMARQHARALRKLSETPAAPRNEGTLPIWEPPRRRFALRTKSGDGARSRCEAHGFESFSTRIPEVRDGRDPLCGRKLRAVSWRIA
jgi:hypothetical protein